ncbi:MAG: hypothetical protein KC912_06875 [Proteobacteria bacterium]|nr:hypothetical protein [Pseudomonadota bacterium]
MQAIRAFIAGQLRQPPIWQLWAGMLWIVNGVVPLFFLGHTEALVVPAVFALCVAIGVGLAQKQQGFTKLIGLMHFPWFGLVFWLLPRLAHAPADTNFGQWLRMLLAMNLTSLVIDVVDVARYVLGDRAPT